MSTKLSATQERVLAWLYRNQGSGGVQIAGHGQAPFLSAARALKRRGLAGSHRTGHYYITQAGIERIEGGKS